MLCAPNSGSSPDKRSIVPSRDLVGAAHTQEKPEESERPEAFLEDPAMDIQRVQSPPDNRFKFRLGGFAVHEGLQRGQLVRSEYGEVFAGN